MDETPDLRKSESELRAGDADRARVVERLTTAHSEGRLDLTELDERLGAAWAARTFGELAVLTSDLPATTAPAVVSASGAVSPALEDGGLRGTVSAWAAASLVNLVIWGIVSVTAGQAVYPWWIWVAGPWGVILLVSWLGGRPGPDRAT